MCSHLQTEGCNDRLVVTDSITHVTGVFVLGDQEWILLLPVICGSGCFLVVILWWQAFGFDAPEDPIRPGWLPLLTAEQREGQVSIRRFLFEVVLTSLFLLLTWEAKFDYVYSCKPNVCKRTLNTSAVKVHKLHRHTQTVQSCTYSAACKGE